MKTILILTALSFMSLFGISGWLGGHKNKPVIKVDDIVIYQDEVALQFDQEQRLAKSVFGDSIELNDAIKEAMLQGIVQRELDSAIIARTAEKYNIYISDDLIRRIIFSQAEFMDENGRFNVEKLRRVLSLSGWSEARYINSIRKDVVKQNLIHNPVEHANVPKILLEKMAKLESQRKVFKYIKIDPAEVKIDRNISKEEVEQYYEDFGMNFMEPEKRDVTFVVIENADMAKKVMPLEAEIKEYYEANISQFETPEERTVLQIIAPDEKTAEQAYQEIKASKDFYDAAEKFVMQSKAETNLGQVSKDMLIETVAEGVFAAKNGELLAPIQSELGWHVLKVTHIKPGTKMSPKEANTKIVQALRQEQAYNAAYDAAKEIDTKVGGGASLKDIAQEMGFALYEVKGLTEDGSAKTVPSAFRELLKSEDFIGNAFSYNAGEVSQVIDLEDGYLVMEVTHVDEVHAKPLDSVKGEIEKLWAENEKNAIAQEVLNDVMADLEHGDEIGEIAARFQLKLNETKPLKRSENFEKIMPNDMIELFHQRVGQPLVVEQGNVRLVAVPAKVIEQEKSLAEDDLGPLKTHLKMDLGKTYSSTLINGFASGYDVRVKYRLLGLTGGL